MARPKGSKNKPKIELTKRKDGSAVITIKMEKQVEGMPINRDSSLGWVKWGQRNDYPQRLSDLYYNSVTHKSCIDFAVTAILGDGVDYEKMKEKESELVPNYQYGWDELIERISLDYILYGSYAIQIIKNNDDNTYSFFHQPFADVRFSPRNEDGVIESYWICPDWTQTGLYPPVELKSFSFMEEEEIKSGKAYLFVYDGYSPDITYYPIPNYISALKPIQTEIEIQRYDLRSVTNNFSASGLLTLNRIDDEEDKQMIIQNIQAMFTGADNANSLIINFKNNDEEQPATFVKIDKDAGNSVNLFEQNNNRVISKIIAAHKISNKALIGYEADSAMLGGEGNIINVAFNLYNKTVANKLRRNILTTLNKALAMNGVDTQLILKPLQFNIANTSDTSTNNTQVIDTEEDTEKATTENNNNNLD